MDESELPQEKMDGEAADGDVVVDSLGFGADLADLVLGQPGHWVVAVGPLGGDLLLERGVDFHGGAAIAEGPGGLIGVVGFVVVDAGQGHGCVAGPAESVLGEGGAGEIAVGPVMVAVTALV
ncbi:hypothetical protein [Streptomyces sp. NPDC048269]|uniref:hypothetical protein n=1 Tax=Streptomyces sp. NPDC048269 TaxID=3155753 RepID=UPI0034413046